MHLAWSRGESTAQGIRRAGFESWLHHCSMEEFLCLTATIYFLGSAVRFNGDLWSNLKKPEIITNIKHYMLI